VRGWSGSRRPDVRPEMVVVASGGQEQSARITPDRLAQAESSGVETLGVVQVSDMQMYMAHRGAWRQSIPFQTTPGCNHIVEVERIGRHHQFPITPLPHLPGTIRVDLDSESVGIHRYSASLTR